MYFKFFCLTAVLFVVSYGTAFAYLDPGTGSLIIQGLIAGFLAVAVAGRLYISKAIGSIKRLFGGRSEVESKAKEPDNLEDKDNQA